MTRLGVEPCSRGADAVGVLSRPRLWAGVFLLAATAVACGTADRSSESSPWGAEANQFFDGLSQAYSENDFYGVLDFYSPNAFQERWRGSVRGGALVRDLLRWNSGDLGHEVIDIHLGPEGALALIKWERPGGLSVILSTFEDGLITGETVYDHGAWLEIGLRSTPDIVSSYEALYRDYADVWTKGTADDLDAVYSGQATLEEPLIGTGAQGVTSIFEASPSIGRVDVIDLAQTVNTVQVNGPAIFLGPADFGVDPARAVAIYNMTDGNDCSRQVAVVWQMDNGQIVEETRYEEVESFSRCRSERLPDGWWTGLQPPPPRDEAVTGVLRTSGGQDLIVHNGTPGLEQALLGWMQRFGDAEMAEPRFDTVTFEPSRSCVNRSGRVIQSDGSRDLFLCIFDSDLCPRDGTCETTPLRVRLSAFHELAHAWMLDHVDNETRTQVLGRTGRLFWQDDTVPWSERGVEYAAEVITWGLLDEAVPMVRIGRPTCQELTASFKLLVTTDPLRADCGSS